MLWSILVPPRVPGSLNFYFGDVQPSSLLGIILIQSAVLIQGPILPGFQQLHLSLAALKPHWSPKAGEKGRRLVRGTGP